MRDDRTGPPRGYEPQPYVTAMVACGALGLVFILCALLGAFGLQAGPLP